MDTASKVKIAILVILLSALPAYIFLTFLGDLMSSLLAGARAQLFGQVFVAILLEAFPFVLLGSIVSGVVEVLVPPERIARFVPKRLGTRLLAAATLGLVLPMCGCGIVPVARRLVRKGLPLEMAMVYMLAGPIVNPVVIASTAVAFVGQGLALWMSVARILCGVAVAMVVGLVVAHWDRGATAARQVDRGSQNSGGHPKGSHVLPQVMGHMVHDFLLLGGYLLFGSILAAAFQAFVPRDVIVSIARTPVLSSAGMMVMAFAMNLCSETDAFVAAAFSQFSFAARLAFLVLGPMLSFKMAAMFLGAFPRRMLVLVVVVAAPLVLAVCEISGWLFACLGG
jgi:uncharacterized membrane protein YraQ (UPF0718 family)